MVEKIPEMSQARDSVIREYHHLHPAGDQKLSESHLKQVPLGKNFRKETLVASKLAT